ncbi:hypothetical protein Maq22A_c27980 [Methylobacterium aquaticum]|uniref:Uncharacterized protein n=1 Tax=Methylobacterium aquaticum TaxID=270351 RepID=A0A1Y0ZC16_9HYPH|nr:hypothetical protein Maq22A_c27980 [Methylobacterium aquaticum]
MGSVRVVRADFHLQNIRCRSHYPAIQSCTPGRPGDVPPTASIPAAARPASTEAPCPCPHRADDPVGCRPARDGMTLQDGVAKLDGRAGCFYPAAWSVMMSIV